MHPARQLKVNLFIVGAAKAGTSSLWAALKQHPAVFAPADELHKEPSFFTPIANHIGLERYHKLYADAKTEQYLMDASTPYLTHPGAAEAIHDYNPNAKIIIILRNPTDRAYSHYCWMVAEGYEWVPSFDEALALEEQRVNTPEDRASMPNYFWNYMYKRSGLYKGQVDRFMRSFGINVLLINFHDLVNYPNDQLSRIQDFLDIDPIALPLERENPALSVYSPSLTFATRKFQQRLTNRFPSYFNRTKRRRDALVRATQLPWRPPPLSALTRQKLDAYFAADLDLLRTCYGLDIADRPLQTLDRAKKSS